MNLKHFDIFSCSWIDITPEGDGSTLEWNTETGWEFTGGYKKYIVQITQAGTDAPIATILENTLGFTPDWKRDSAGIYGFDWDVDFVSTKCAIYISQLYLNKDIYFDYDAEYNVTLYTGGNDGYISKTTFEIRYYN